MTVSARAMDGVEESPDQRRIQLTPLLGAHDEGPLSYLLVIDSFTILLDCCWDDRLQLETIQPIIECAPLLAFVRTLCVSPTGTIHISRALAALLSLNSRSAQPAS